MLSTDPTTVYLISQHGGSPDGLVGRAMIPTLESGHIFKTTRIVRLARCLLRPLQYVCLV